MEYQNRFDLFEHEIERFSKRTIIYATADVTRENTHIQHNHIDRPDVVTNRSTMSRSSGTFDIIK